MHTRTTKVLVIPVITIMYGRTWTFNRTMMKKTATVTIATIVTAIAKLRKP